jgi:hypothetical protein
MPSSRGGRDCRSRWMRLLAPIRCGHQLKVCFRSVKSARDSTDARASADSVPSRVRGTGASQKRSRSQTLVQPVSACARHGSLCNSQLRYAQAVVQFTHIRNHAGSYGPDRRFATPLSGSIFPLIQSLDLEGTAPALKDPLVPSESEDPVPQCPKSFSPRQEDVRPAVLHGGTDVGR